MGEGGGARARRVFREISHHRPSGANSHTYSILTLGLVALASAGAFLPVSDAPSGSRLPVRLWPPRFAQGGGARLSSPPTPSTRYVPTSTLGAWSRYREIDIRPLRHGGPRSQRGREAARHRLPAGGLLLRRRSRRRSRCSKYRLDTLARRFFARPVAEKAEIAMARGGRAWRGWFPVGGELTDGVADDKEGLYFGAELGPEHPRVARRNADARTPTSIRGIRTNSQRWYGRTWTS